MLEHPALKFHTIDITVDDSESGIQETCYNLLSVLEKSLSHQDHELELIQRNGILYCSRLVPDEEYNNDFQLKLHKGTQTVPLLNLESGELVCSETGQIDSLCMRACVPSEQLERGFIEVDTKAVGLNFKVSILKLNLRHSNTSRISRLPTAVLIPVMAIVL